MEVAAELGTVSTRALLDTLGPRAQALESRAPESQKRQLRELCEQMEGIFLAVLMRQMRQTIWKNDFLPEGAGEDIFRGLYELEVGERMAQRGGFGISDALFEQLERSATWQKGHLIHKSS